MRKNKLRNFAPRLTALLLAFVLTVGLPVGVLAAETPETETAVSSQTDDAGTQADTLPDASEETESDAPDASSAPVEESSSAAPEDESGSDAAEDSSVSSSPDASQPTEEPADSVPEPEAPTSSLPAEPEDPAASTAQEDEPEEEEEPAVETAATDFTYTTSGSTATITKYTGAGGSVTIPATLDGYTVTAIGRSAFESNKTITAITFQGNSLTKIDSYAFRYCSGITSLRLPAGLVDLGIYAFSNCTSLRSVWVPKTLTSTSIFPNFSGSNNLTSIEFEPGTTIIPNSLFQDCKGLTTVTFPAGVTTVDNSAFDGASSLTQVNFPASLTTIENHAFQGANLTSLDLRHTQLSSIGWESFRGNKHLASVAFPKTLTHGFVLGVFKGCPITSVDLAQGATVVPSGLFTEVTTLASVVIPNSVTEIESSAFEGCTGLQNVTLSTNLQEIDSYAFRNCTSLASIYIPDKVTSLGIKTFKGCTNLRTASLPAALEYSDDVFEDCPNLVINHRVVPVTKLALNMSSKILRKGSSITLKATVSPSNATNKTVTYKSGNTKVATVNAKTGKVVAKGYGTAVITAKVGTKTAKCTIRVHKTSVAVTKVTLNASSLRLPMKGSYTLKATVSPAKAANKKVTWTSSNPGVATVSSKGVVKAVTPGSTTITATTAEGGRVRTCRVTVLRYAVTRLKLSRTKYTLKRGASVTLRATASPTQVKNATVIWSSNKPKVATVSSNGRIKGISKGVATITARVGNKTVRCKITVK